MEEDGESTQGDRKEGKLTKIWEGDKRRSRVRETLRCGASVTAVQKGATLMQ